MSKKVKIILGSVVAVIVVALVVLVLYTNGLIFKNDPYNIDNYDEYVTVGEYKGLEYDKVSVSVTDEEIDTEIQTRLTNAATTEKVTSGTVKDGDTINISFEGKIDGETFDGGSSDSYELTIGQTSMIDGFTDGLIGMKVGDTKELNLTFPDDYSNEDVAGKDVVFTVTVNTKSVTTTPEYDEDFIKNNSDYDNKKDYEASVKEDLLASKTEDAEADIKDTLWSKVTEASEISSYPEGTKDAEIEKFKAQYETYAESYGVEFDDFLETYMGMTEDEFNEQADTYAESVVKSKLVMYSIAKTEGIEIDEDKYDEYLQDMLKDASYTEDSFEEAFGMSIEKYAEENDFEYYYLLNQVIDKVMEYGTEK